MEIKKENIVNAYQNGDESVKKMLRTMFPNIKFETAQAAENRPVTERIKTFADAVEELGEEHPFVRQWASFVGSSFDEGVDKDNADLYAYYKLRIITAALNEGWQPKSTVSESHWCPIFDLRTNKELVNMSDEWKQNHPVIATDNYDTEWEVFASAYSPYSPSGIYVQFGSRLCYKSEELAGYSGKQFINLWADLNLIRKQ